MSTHHYNDTVNNFLIKKMIVFTKTGIWPYVCESESQCFKEPRILLSLEFVIPVTWQNRYLCL